MNDSYAPTRTGPLSRLVTLTAVTLAIAVSVFGRAIPAVAQRWMVLAIVCATGTILARSLVGCREARGNGRRDIETPLLFGSIIAIDVAFLLWNFPFPFAKPWLLGAILFLLCGICLLALIFLRFAGLFAAFNKTHWALFAAACVFSLLIQYVYVVAPLEYAHVATMPDAPRYIFYLFRFITGIFVVCAVPVTIRLTGSHDMLWVQSFTMIHLSGFDWCHRLALGDMSISTWAWQVRALAMLALGSAVLSSYLDGTVFTRQPARTVTFFSARCFLSVAVFLGSVLLLIGLYLLGTFDVINGLRVSNVLMLVFAVWSASNWLAVYVASRLEEVRSLMPDPAKIDSSEEVGAPLQIPKIERVLPMAELRGWIDGYNGVIQRANKLTAELNIRNREKAMAELAARVAHDIRSPLAALNMSLGELQIVSEEARTLARSAIYRIQDIANELLERNRSGSDADDYNPAFIAVLLSSLIEVVISEKRTQFRSRLSVTIESKMGKASYGLFVKVQPGLFKRVLSNLLNNAVEAISTGGKVVVDAREREGDVVISVEDDGCGIPPDVLANLGCKQITHGKAEGNGIGVHHARVAVEAWGGRLQFYSEAGKGTRVELFLPMAIPPGWFQSEIDVKSLETVVVCDDDASIHGIWLDRFSREAPGLRLLHTSTPDELRFAVGDVGVNKRTLYLIDYELLGQNVTGIDLARELALGSRGILVTSRFEENDIVSSCLSLGIKLIPKSVAAHVPFTNSAERLFKAADVVLIDDDALVQRAWAMAARAKGKNLVGFVETEEFLVAADFLRRDIPIFIDSDLGSGQKGEEFSLEIYRLGFTSIYLATGHAAETFDERPWIKQILGKEPPSNFFTGTEK